MDIEFKFIDKQEIKIIGVDEKTKERKEIGRIFTPSGSGHDVKNAIQVCGFDEAFDFWGCGIYGDKKTQKMKKDIQLQFSLYDKMNGEGKRYNLGKTRHDLTPAFAQEEYAKVLSMGAKNMAIAIGKKE